MATRARRPRLTPALTMRSISVFGKSFENPDVVRVVVDDVVDVVEVDVVGIVDVEVGVVGVVVVGGS